MALEFVINVKDNGSLAIKNVTQQANTLSQSFAKVDKQTNILNLSVSKASIAFGNLAAQGLGKIGGMLKDFASEMIQTYDSAAKLSENVGITAESVMGLRHAAELSNVGAEAMDKNLAKLSKSISDAASGSKQASAAFAKMGIDVKNADGSVKNSEQVLMEMADAFKELPAGAQRAGLAMDVFGKSGASMVSMLKDGSAGLKEMVDEGKAAAGNVEGISAAMEDLNDAATRAKAVLMGMIATLVDTAPFQIAINGISSLSKEWAKFAAERKEAGRIDAMKDEIAAVNEYGEAVKKYYSAIGTDKRSKEVEDYAAKMKKLENEAKKAGASETLLAAEKLNSGKAVLAAMEKQEGQYKKIENVRRMANADLGQLKQAKSQEEAAAAAAKAAEQERIDAAKAAADYEKSQKAREEAGKAAKKAADEAARAEAERIKEAEAATKSLAELDEKMRIAALDGEAKKLAQIDFNYQKQFEDLERLHEAQLKNADDWEKIEQEQAARIEALGNQHLAEQEAVRQETIKGAEAAAKSLADFDKQIAMDSLDGEAQKQAQLESNYQKQLEDLARLHEAQMAGAENREELEREQSERLLKLKEQHLQAVDALEQQQADRDRERKLSAVSDSFSAMQQITAGHKSFAVLYKASAIGEATVNAAQSVLRTMSSVPYPFNIPLAALQAAAAAVQVSKIASAKMYAGGMIKGRNRLIMANEEGEEAILNTRAVRAVGGAAGVNALNSGIYNNSSYSYDNRRSSSTIVINSALMSPKILSEEIMPAFERQNRRR